MAAALGCPPCDIDKRFLSCQAKLVAGDQFEVFVVVAVGLVELAVETAHLGHVVVEFGLHGIIACLDEAVVRVFGLGIVVHQAVALANLKVDAVLLSPVARHTVVGLLVALQCKDVLLILELLVGLGGDTVLCHGHTGPKQGYSQ